MLTISSSSSARGCWSRGWARCSTRQQPAWWPRSNAAPSGFTASAGRGRSGLGITPSPSQGGMLVDALFEALVHVLANANASLKVASTRRK
jgi:hypothetical protein